MTWRNSSSPWVISPTARPAPLVSEADSTLILRLSSGGPRQRVRITRAGVQIVLKPRAVSRPSDTVQQPSGKAGPWEKVGSPGRHLAALVPVVVTLVIVGTIESI